jgi:hypothetical protein
MKTLLGAFIALTILSALPAGATTICRATAVHGLRVHKWPATYSQHLYSLPYKTKVIRVRVKDGWAKVHRLNNNRQGWASRNFLACWSR